MRLHRNGFCQGVDRIISEFRPQRRHWDSEACFQFRQSQYFSVIDQIRDQTAILHQDCWNKGSFAELRRIVRALSCIAARYPSRVRNLEDWRPVDNGPAGQTRSLIRHLFFRYTVPGFLLNAWFCNDRFARRDIRFSVLIGKGKNPRHANLVFGFTKPSIREFMSAPDDLSVNQAWRWAQVRIENGSPKLARLLVELLPRVSEDYQTEAFWIETIRFFAAVENAPELGQFDSQETETIIEFAKHIRFYSPTRMLGFRLRDPLPLNVNFSLEGKTPKWIRRYMINWRQELAVEIERRRLEAKPERWTPSAIRPYESSDSLGTWTITELRAKHEMVAEGHFMRHCVASDHYVEDCRNRKISIWSLKRLHNRRNRRMATIEVETESSEIVTALGKCNETPTQESQNIIRAWAAREKLAFSPEELYE